LGGQMGALHKAMKPYHAILFCALLAGCAHVSDYDRIVSSTAVPAQVRLAVDREPAARALFRIIAQDCRAGATPASAFDVRTYAAGLVMGQEGRWKPDTYRAVCMVAVMLDNDARPRNLLQVAAGIDEGLAKPQKSTQPDGF